MPVEGSLILQGVTITGTLVLEQGPPGPRGLIGPAGSSAYEIWLAEGNVGTEQDFLDSTVGADGAPGVGVPVGGGPGQLLAKIDAADYNTEWVNAPVGPGPVGPAPVRQYLAADIVVTGSTTTTASDLSITIPTGFSLVWSFFGRCNGSVANDFIVQAVPVGGTMDYGDVLVIWGSGRISGRPGGFGVAFAAKGDNDDEIVTMTGGTFPNTTGQDGLLTFRYSQRIFSAETTATLRKGAYVEYELIPN